MTTPDLSAFTTHELITAAIKQLGELEKFLIADGQDTGHIADLVTALSIASDCDKVGSGLVDAITTYRLRAS